MGPVINKAIVQVPQQSAYVVEYLGKYQHTLSPGLNFLIPFIQKVAYKHSLKEQAFPVNAQSAVTKDNVYIQIDGVVYLRVDDPVKCSYGSIDPLNYTYTLAQSIMRSEIGKLTLDKTFEERETMNSKILESLSSAISEWGIKCLRYEIKDIKLSDSMRKIMNLEAESERQKRADVITSEGKKGAEVNVAEGLKKSILLRSEALSQQIYLKGEATSNRIKFINKAFSELEGEVGANFKLREKYINALRNLGDDKKNLIIKANLNNPKEILQKALGDSFDVDQLVKSNTKEEDKKI